MPPKRTTSEPRKKRQTAAERHEQEIAEHVNKVLPRVNIDCFPALMLGDGTGPEIKLSESVIGCQCNGVNTRLFGDVLEEHCNHLDDLNVYNWGYPDGYTGIWLLNEDLIQCLGKPWAVVRHRHLSNTGTSADWSTIFASPRSSLIGRMVVGVGEWAEFYASYDSKSGETWIPQKRTTLHDDQTHRSDLHVVTRFSKPPDVSSMFAHRIGVSAARQSEIRRHTPNDMCIAPVNTDFTHVTTLAEFMTTCNALDDKCETVGWVFSKPTVFDTTRVYPDVKTPPPSPVI